MLSPRNQLRVGPGEALLDLVGDRLRDVALHHLAQQQLAVARALEVALGLRAGLVLVELARPRSRSRSFSAHGHALGEVDEVVVEERHAALEPVRHAQLVLDDEQAVQERLRLEVERVVDVVLGRVSAGAVSGTRRGRCRSCAGRATSSPDVGAKSRCRTAFGHQPLPEAVVLVDVVVEVVVDDRAVVAPRVAGEQLVAAGARQHDLDELARPGARRSSSGSSGRRAGPRGARSARGRHALHVAGLEHHLVVLGAGTGRTSPRPWRARRSRARGPTREVRSKPTVNVFRYGSACGRERGDRAGVHAAAQVGADRHVADELAVDGLAEEAVELLVVLRVRRAAPSSGSRKSKSQ